MAEHNEPSVDVVASEMRLLFRRSQTDRPPLDWDKIAESVREDWRVMARWHLAALASHDAQRGEGVVCVPLAPILDYVDRSLAACRKAEEQRNGEIGKPENHRVDAMLREQAHAWREKASSYEALRTFLESLPPTRAALERVARAAIRECMGADGIAWRGATKDEIVARAVEAGKEGE